MADSMDDEGKLMRMIRELRQARGWTQYELAIKVGVHPQAVFFWENGRRTPQVPQMRKLGQVFGLYSDEILLESVPTVPQRSRVRSARQMPDAVRGSPRTRKRPKD